MFLIFRPGITEPTQAVELTPDEFRHARARRLSAGAPMVLGDGAGRRWPGFFEPGSAKNAHWVRNPELPSEFRREPTRLLCTAVPSGKRWDWLLQKATELGVTRIIPVEFRHSERVDFSASRSERILEEAAVQARRYFLPRLEAPVALKNLPAALGELESPGSLVVLDPNGESDARVAIAGPTAILVGPEGGIDESELERLRAAGRPIVRARSSAAIMRVETAALYGLAWLDLFGDANV